MKLDSAMVVRILLDPRLDKDVASEFGVRENTICRIRTGARWSKVAPHISRQKKNHTHTDGAALVSEKTALDLDSDCWIWGAATQSAGYGLAQFRGRLELAHRISYEAFIGAIAPGMLVLHTCDRPPCCNPAHLFQGTNQDNKDDCVRKGRHSRGRAHSASIISAYKRGQVTDAPAAQELS